MSKFNYDGPRQFKPISPWGYIGYSILFAIPIIGLIFLIVFALSDRNINRRSYARSFFCWVLVGIIIGILLATGVLGGFLRNVNIPGLANVQSITQNLPFKAQTVASKPGVTVAPDDADTGIEEPLPEEPPEQKPDNAPEKIVESTDTGNLVEVQVGSKAVQIDKSFKDAMDKYEAFFDEYVDVLESQDAMKLASYTLKYAQAMEAFENVKDDDLTEAEEAYYIAVQSRINQKLMSYQ